LLRPLYLCLCLLLASNSSFAQQTREMSVEDYGARFFPPGPVWQTLWINQPQRERIEEILGHRFSQIRIRYWGQDSRTGWVFEEIGKELPITVGVIVEDDQIVDLSVLEFRESRGGEVVYPFFTGQFNSAKLRKGDAPALDKTIDGITGATLSVRAVKKVATLALYTHQLAPFSQANP